MDNDKKESIEDFTNRELLEMIFYALADIDRRVQRIDTFLAEEHGVEKYLNQKNTTGGIEDHLKKFIDEKSSLDIYIRRILDKEK